MASTSRGSIQSQHSTFDDENSVEPLLSLMDDLLEDLDDDHFNKLLFITRDKLNPGLYKQLSCDTEHGRCYKYFMSLKGQLGEDGTVSLIEEVMTEWNYHGHLGEVCYKEKIRQYKEEKKRYLENRVRKVIRDDVNFVGREDVIYEVLNYLISLKGEVVCIMICGVSGMGKTSVAYQVCRILMERKPAWDIVVVDQREKTELKELLIDLVFMLSRCQTMVCDLDIASLKLLLCNLLAEKIESTKETLIVLDNVDGHCDDSILSQFLDLLQDIIGQITGKDCKIRLLITVCRNIVQEIDNSQRGNMHLKGKISEIELTSLDSSDVGKLLQKITKENFPSSLCDSICKDCYGSPMYVKSLANLLKNKFKMKPDRMSLKYILKKTLQILDIPSQAEEKILPKNFLARFAVFKTTHFDMKVAQAIGCDLLGDQKSQQQLPEIIKLNLALLEDNNLLEVDNLSGLITTGIGEKRKLFSLHPLVWEFMSLECNNCEDLKAQRSVAKANFLKYFCAEIDKFGKKLDYSPIDANCLLEENMSLIKQFFTIILSDDVFISVDKLLPKKNTKIHTSLWKIAEFAIEPVKKLKFTAKLAEIAKNEKDLFVYIYWKANEADYHITHNRLNVAEQIMDALMGQLGIVSMSNFECSATDWHRYEEYKTFSVGRFYTVRGRLYYMQAKGKGKDGEAMLNRAHEQLKMAEKVFHHKKHVSLSDRAYVKNLIGCVYFEKRNYNCASNYHKKALEKINSADWHLNYAEYCGNIATCYHQKALISEIPNKRKQQFEKALDMYNKAIKSNTEMKRDVVIVHAVLLSCRADLYYAMGNFEKMLSDWPGKVLPDARSALNIIQNVLKPPHVEITLIQERLGYYNLKLGKKTQKEMKYDEATNHFQKAFESFDLVLEYIRAGGLPMEHSNGKTYTDIKKNHIEVMRLLNMDEHIKRNRMDKYMEFEQNGATVRNMEDLYFDREEFLKEHEAKGTLVNVHLIDDDNEEESSSSKQHDMGSKSAKPTFIIDNQIEFSYAMRIAAQRRDSGIEELDDENFQDVTDKATDITETDNMFDMPDKCTGAAGSENVCKTLDQSVTRGPDTEHVFVMQDQSDNKLHNRQSYRKLVRQLSIDSTLDENEVTPATDISSSIYRDQSGLKIEEKSSNKSLSSKFPSELSEDSFELESSDVFTVDNHRPPYMSSSSYSSGVCTSFDERHNSWQDSSGLQESLSSDSRHPTLSSIGLQDNVTSHMDKMGIERAESIVGESPRQIPYKSSSSTSSYISTSSVERQDSWQDASGSEASLGSETRRRKFSSLGSQNSVTSQMIKIGIDQAESTVEVDEPPDKLHKT